MVDSLQRMMAEKGIRAGEHPAWMHAFNDERRYEQLDEDHQAWKAVTGTLMFIITVGVTLAVITVILCS